MKTLYRIVSALLLFGLAAAPSAAVVPQFDTSMAWPLCGHDTLPAGSTSCPAERWGNPDYADPLTSATFGPRPLISEDSRYDFHRGLDIPAPLGTPIFAVSDGIVRTAGIDSSYADPVIIVRHYRPGSSSCSGAGCYHSLYLHVQSWAVAVDQYVVKGQLIGHTGESASGFAHLHFELRDAPPEDPSSSWQRDAIHPLTVLPYTAAGDQTVTIAGVDTSVAGRPEVTVTVTGPRYDVIRVEVELLDASGAVIAQPGSAPDLRGYYTHPPFFDMQVWNRQYTHKNSSAVPWESFDVGGENECPFAADHPASYTAHVHMDAAAPDDFHVGLFNGVRIETIRYWDSDYFLGLTFQELVGDPTCIRATASFTSAEPVTTQWGDCSGGGGDSSARASGETTVFGSLVGDYTQTWQIAGAEVLREVESGGKPARRTSQLEHIWRIDAVAGGAAVRLDVTADVPVNAEGDDFTFATSTDGQVTWQPAFTFANGTSGTLSVDLPGAQGSVFVRVVDTDRTRGNRALDSLNVIEIEVVSQGEVEPLAPSAAVATATSSDSVHLAWIAGAGHAHYRVQTEDPLAPGNYIDAVTTPATAIDMAALPATQYRYEVCGIDGQGAIIGCTVSNTVTTPAFSLTLEANGYKVKGFQTVDLSWNDSSPMDVYRDGARIITGVAGGGTTDQLRTKGAGTYVYQVCIAGVVPEHCSAEVSVVF